MTLPPRGGRHADHGPRPVSAGESGRVPADVAERAPGARTGERPRPTRNPAGAVYGTVLAGSLIAAEGGRDPVDVPRMLLVVLLTQLVYWLAHIYADLVALRIEEERRPRRAEVLHLLRENWSLVAASSGPLLVIAGATLIGVPADTAVLAGLWAIAALLVLWALVAGRRARMGGAELALYTLLSAAFGVALVLLKLLLH